MTTLVLHPFDLTTRFLELVYRDMEVTLVEEYVERTKLRRLMERHDRLMLLGHGTPGGLLSQLGTSYVVDDSFVDLLRERDDTLYVWCYASHFVRRHNLRGFATGMFVSEMSEARLMRVEATEPEVEKSNYVFADVLNRFASMPMPVLRAAVNQKYGRLAKGNPVAKYNLDQMNQRNPKLDLRNVDLGQLVEMGQLNLSPRQMEQLEQAFATLGEASWPVAMAGLNN